MQGLGLRAFNMGRKMGSAWPKIPSDRKGGTYIVTLKCEGEAFPESHRARLVVGFKE